LPDYLLKFNEALSNFQEKFPRDNWSIAFRDSLIVNCEKEKSDTLLVKYFAEGMANYMIRRGNELV
jgi:hypothetical protein